MSVVLIKVVAVVAALFAVAAAAANDTLAEASSPDRRYDPNPQLQANMAFRVIFAIIGTALCWVPFRLLWRNGDFAAVVLIIDVALMNFFTVLNCLIWHNDNWDNWFLGAGLCDIEVYLFQPLETVYAGSIFVIVWQLAQHVKLARASQPSRKERKKRAQIQAAVIFAVPVLQLLFTWFDIAQRYNIGTLIGCIVILDSSWPRFLIYDSPSPLFVLACIPFAILTWTRYRAISKTTREALQSNSAASARANRTRNRLYNMSIAILAVYLPVSLYLLSLNIKDALGGTYLPYNYYRIHWNAAPYPWDAILLIPSWELSTPELNQPWIAIATTVVIVGFFGTTKDGLEMYRSYALALGLGRFFPKLIKPHTDPTEPTASNDDTRGSCVELIDRPNRKHRPDPIDTSRLPHPDPYQIPSSGTTMDADSAPSTGKALSPLDPPAPRRLTSPPERFRPGGLSTKMASPLASSRVIESLIPQRVSSLAHQQQRHYSPALHGPAKELPRITLDTSPTLEQLYQRHGHPSSSSSSRARSHSNRSDTVPILTLPNLHPVAVHGGGSPTTLGSLRGKTSRDAVQGHSVLGEPSFDAAPSSPPPNWPFFAGTALTSSTASVLRPGEPVNEVASGRNASNPAVEPAGSGFVHVPVQGGQQPRHYDMGATRNRGRRIPRSVAEARAEGVRSADTLEDSY
ncbi:pheromone A receptor-domain-containing protein [Jackrogersella minutella]|nr:pheromone A receptor-domain-containing protein [Jackrogersella minutella]